MAVVYLHKTLDTDVIFYVGIGKTKKRAFSKSTRNALWSNIVSKHEYIVEVLYEDISWEEACIHEKRLIKEFGRRDIGTGCLANMTDGGDGAANLSAESRKKISVTSTGRVKSLECRSKLSAKTCGENSIMYGKKGPLHPKFGKKYIFSDEHKQKLSDVRRGRKYTEKHKQAMQVPKGPQEIKICPYCNKTGGNAMTRWHFDNCKNKNISYE
jgi:hypothetical protein